MSEIDYKERLYWALVSSKRLKAKLNWHHAMHTTGVGCTHGRQICIDLGVDPDGTDFVRKEERVISHVEVTCEVML